MKSPAFQLKAGQYQSEETGAKDRSCLILVPLRKRNGYIFGLAKVEKKHSKDLRNICRIISSQASRFVSSLDATNSLQHTFEQFLAGLNQELGEQIRAGAWNFPIEDFNGLVGLACEQEMYLSGTGDLATIFLHKTESERYQIFNLARNLNNEQALPTWEKTFSIILDGDLVVGDIFCLSSQTFNTAISNDELHEILTTLPAESAADKIRQYFPHDAALSILVIKAQGIAGGPGPAGAVTLASPQQSIEHLESTRAQTSQLLKDQKPSGLFFWAKSLLLKIKKTNDQSRPKDRLKSLGKKIAVWLTRNYLVAKIKGRFKTRRQASERVKEVQERAVHALENMRPGKKSYPRSVKYILLAAFSILIIFAVSIYFLTQDNEQAQEIENWQAQIQEINSFVEQGAAAVIYKDEAQARGFYAQAQNLLSEVTGDTPEQQAQLQNIQQEIDSALDQLRHIIKIPEPPLVADFSTVEDFIRAQTLSFFNDQLFVFTNNKQVYLVSLIDKTLEPVETTDGTVGIPLASAADEESLLILDNRPGISQFDPDNKTLKITDQAPPEDNQWVDLKLYGDKLYILQIEKEKNDGQIIRLSRSGSNFGSATQWIQSKSTNLQNATGLAIDGTIFVLKDDGSIIRFARSSEVGWEAGQVEPAIAKATKIWTDVDSDNIYVLEPLGKRVIVYQKETGQFLAQYFMETLNTLKDFQVDEANNKIYLLTDQAVYSIDLSHQ